MPRTRRTANPKTPEPPLVPHVEPTEALIPETRGPLVTLKQWFQDDEIRLKWRQTWEQPHMKAGLQVLIALGLPKPITTLPPGLSFTDVQAHRASRSEGYFNVLDLIEALKNDPPAQGGKVTNGWGVANLAEPPTEKN